MDPLNGIFSNYRIYQNIHERFKIDSYNDVSLTSGDISDFYASWIFHKGGYVFRFHSRC